MKNLFLIPFLFFANFSFIFAQEEDLMSQTTTAVIYPKDINRSKELLKKLIDSAQAKMISKSWLFYTNR